MTSLLLFVLQVLVLFHGQIQTVQALYFSIALPLAVRSPYLSCWLPMVNGSDNAAGISPGPMRSTLNLSQTRDWDVLIRVDGTSYMILGSSVYPSSNASAATNLTSLLPTNFSLANITNTVVTPTRITLNAVAGPMQVNLTILNPIEPGDWVKQSIPFSYLSLTAISQDGSPHNVQVYSGIGGKWVSAYDDNVSTGLNQKYMSLPEVQFHIIALSDKEQIKFGEIWDQAAWGTLYFAMKNDSNISSTVSDRLTSLTQFGAQGSSTGLIEGIEIYSTSAWDNGIVFGISRDLGTIQALQPPVQVVWAVGYTTDPAINYPVQSNSSQNARSPYYRLQYADDQDLLIDFINDFDNASQRAQALDQRILKDAASVSNLLGDLVSLAVPQVYGSAQITVGRDANGNFNKSDVMMFMKNVGGDIDRRVNAVETLYAAFPALMYIDPHLGAPLLEPLFRVQASPDIQYAPKDLGSSYPNVNPSMSTHSEGVEQTGNMLIMTYAHARASGDESLISKYYSVLTRWADYLINTSLLNDEQSDIDGENNAYYSNQTNLAIKGIIAIAAMSKMSSFAERNDDADRYSRNATDLYLEWKTAGLGSDQHLLARYHDGENPSWTLGYNLFADKWLGLGLVEDSIYDGHSSYLNNIPLNSVGSPDQLYDIPIESMCDPDCYPVSSSWNLFVAAMAQNTSSNLTSNRIAEVYKRATSFGNQSLGVFPFRYTSDNGTDLIGIANPAQGAMFAPLALKIPVQINTTSTTPGKASPLWPHAASVAKPVAGAVTALLLVTGILAFILWRRRRSNIGESPATSSAASLPVRGIELTPFTPRHLNETHGNAEPWMEWQEPLSGPRSPSFVPVGLTSKELARIRAETIYSQPAVTLPDSDESRSQPLSLPVVASGLAATSSPIIRAEESQLDRLWREIHQFTTERLRSEAPPSYTEGNVQERRVQERVE